MANLRVNLPGLDMKNPVIPASGTFAVSYTHLDVYKRQTFDPVTNGHLDIIERASRMYDHLYVTIFNNPSKQTMFTLSN